MPRPFKKKTFRDTIEDQIGELAGQTEELRKQVVERAPGVRDQIVAALPDKDQLVDLRDDLFDRLPENVQERLPEQVKPKRKRLRKVAAIGVLTGAGAAAFAVLKRRGTAPETTYAPPVPPPAPTPAPAQSTDPLADPVDDSVPAPEKTPTKKP